MIGLPDRLRIDGFDEASFRRLLELFSAPGPGPRGALVVLVDEQDTVLGAWHSARPEPVEIARLEDPASLATRFGAAHCVIVAEAAAADVLERIALSVQPSDDFLTQLLLVWRSARDLAEGAGIRIYPDSLRKVPIPSPTLAKRALDYVLPDDQCLLLVTYHAGKIATSMVIHRKEGVVARVAGPLGFRDRTGPLSGELRRDYKIILDTVSHVIAPVALGVFAEHETLRELIHEAEPGDWARRAAARDLLIAPQPAYASMALVGDAARALRGAFGGEPGARRPAWADVARTVRGLGRGRAALRDTLGFDPVALLTDLLARPRDP